MYWQVPCHNCFQKISLKMLLKCTLVFVGSHCICAGRWVMIQPILRTLPEYKSFISGDPESWYCQQQQDLSVTSAGLLIQFVGFYGDINMPVNPVCWIWWRYLQAWWSSLFDLMVTSTVLSIQFVGSDGDINRLVIQFVGSDGNICRSGDPVYCAWWWHLQAWWSSLLDLWVTSAGLIIQFLGSDGDICRPDYPVC